MKNNLHEDELLTFISKTAQELHELEEKLRAVFEHDEKNQQVANAIFRVIKEREFISGLVLALTTEEEGIKQAVMDLKARMLVEESNVITSNIVSIRV